MIINGNTFAYGAFQIDTRPLYITFSYDSSTSKYVPDVDYTLQQITEAAKTRPIFAKVAEYIVPLVSLSSSSAEFKLYLVYDPLSPHDTFVLISVIRTSSAWDVAIQEA